MSASPRPPFVHRSTVRFTHTDPAGYVFFPRYFEKLQATVEDWFNKALGVAYADFIMKERRGLPTARTECDFQKPCFLGEDLDIALYLEKIGNSSLHVRFEGSVSGDPRLVARSVLVVISTETGKPLRIDDDLRQRLAAYKASTG